MTSPGSRSGQGPERDRAGSVRKFSLDTAPALRHSDVARGVRGTVDRENKIIHGYSVITRGEARTHGVWIDATMLQQTADAINASRSGAKSRFTHPSLSADGLGKYLGRSRNAVIDGDQVYADLHLSDVAHDAPDGDLATYVMDLAEQDPSAFGASIVFARDTAAEEQFARANTGKDGRFASPDPGNKFHLPHARLAELRASDIVDTPSANPNGLFHQQSIAHEADALGLFMLGMADACPSTQLDVHPDRLRAFAQRFLSQHGLKIVKETPVPESAPPKDRLEADPPRIEPAKGEAAPDALSGDDLIASGRKMELDRFGQLADAFKSDPAYVVECYAKGRSLADAQAEAKDRRLAQLEKEVKELKARQAAGGAEPVGFGGEPDAGGNDFTSQAKARAAEKKLTLHKAMSELAREQPELYQAHKAGLARLPRRK